MVPPGTWSTAWNKRPGQILETVHKHEAEQGISWEDALLEGWFEAAARAQDMDWLEALFAHEIKRENGRRLLEMFPRLPPDFQEKWMISLLGNNPSLSYEQPAAIYLSACRHPWSAEMTRAVTACICWNLQHGSLHPWRWEKLLRDIPPYFHPDLLPDSIQRIDAALQDKEGGDPFASTLISTLEFRVEIHHAFVK